MLENQLFCDVTFAFNCKREVGKVKRNRNVHCIVTSSPMKASLLTIFSSDTYSLSRFLITEIVVLSRLHTVHLIRRDKISIFVDYLFTFLRIVPWL